MVFLYQEDEKVEPDENIMKSFINIYCILQTKWPLVDGKVRLNKHSYFKLKSIAVNELDIV